MDLGYKFQRFDFKENARQVRCLKENSFKLIIQILYIFDNNNLKNNNHD